METMPVPVKEELLRQIRLDGGKGVAARVGLHRTTLYDALSDRAGAKATEKIKAALFPPTKNDND